MARSKAKKRSAALKRAMTAPKGSNPFEVFQVPARPGRKRAQRKKKQFRPAPLSFTSQAAAAAYSRGQKSSEPRFLSRTARGTRIVHRELVASVTGSSSFTVQVALALNPGISATFPWLSTQAVGWEQYKFHKLKFCYYTRTATSTPGSMMLVPDYDAADSAPLSEQIASSYRDVVEEVPWTVEFSCDLDPVAMMEPGNRKYIRTAALASNLDIKTYDGGNFFVCTTDGTAVNWGKLWVEYDVEFFVPQLPPSGAVVYDNVITGAGTISKTAYFGTAPTSTGSGSSSALGMTVTFQKVGYFLVTLYLTGTGVVNPTVSGTSVSQSLAYASAGTAQTTGVTTTYVEVTVPGQTLVYADGGSTTVTASTLIVSPSSV